MTVHKTPAEHYAYAEEVLQHCEALRVSLRDDALSRSDYIDTKEAIAVLLQAAAVAASLAAVSPNVAGQAGKLIAAKEAQK